LDNKGNYQMAANRCNFCLGALASGVFRISYLAFRLGEAIPGIDTGTLGDFIFR